MSLSNEETGVSMSAKLYKIYPEYEGITAIKTGKSKILPVIQLTRRGKPYLIARRLKK